MKKLPGFPGSLKRRGILMESFSSAPGSRLHREEGRTPRSLDRGVLERRGDPLGKHL
jgi:hypothetical protein